MDTQTIVHLWNTCIALQRPVLDKSLRRSLAPFEPRRVHSEVDWLVGNEANLAVRLPLLKAQRDQGLVQALILVLVSDYFSESAQVRTRNWASPARVDPKKSPSRRARGCPMGAKRRFSRELPEVTGDSRALARSSMGRRIAA